MTIDQRLVDAAIAQARSRFPRGSGGAAALYTADGRILTSVCFDTPNESANLCHETGAICEANRLGLEVIASVCVSRESEAEPFLILSPCGICQERLAAWGSDVTVAVPLATDPTRWQAKSLREVQPFYWRNALEPSGKGG
jgi:cytidine deaminase